MQSKESGIVGMTFRIEKAAESDYLLFAGIIETVHEKLEQKEWFAADNAEYTYRMLKSGNGIGYKAVEEASREVAGIFLVTFPKDSEENLGRDIGLGEEELSLVAHMDSVAILPEYRGWGLQRRLMQHAEKELTEKGYRYLMCTVHPENRYSRKNVTDQGYTAVKTALKYGGYLREILLKQIGGQAESNKEAE